jgi:glycosyltransferase 2 family protein
MTVSPRTIIRILIAAVLVGAIVWRIDFSEVADRLGAVALWPMVLAVALALAQVALTALRWHVVLGALGVSLALAANVRAHIVSIFANSLILNVVAGIVTRAVYLRERGQPMRHAFTSSIIERALVMALLVLLTGIGLARLELKFTADTAELARWGLAALAAAALALVVLRVSRLWWRDRARFAEAEVGRAMRDALGVARNVRALSIAAALTLASQAALIGLGVAVARALGVDVSLVDLVTILPIIALVAAIPISIAGFGIREYGAAVLLGALGVPLAQAALVGFLIGVASLVGTGIAGTVALVLRRRDRLK